MTDGSTHPTILVWGQDDVLHYIDPTGKRQHGSIGTVAIFTTPLAGTLGSFTTLFHAIAVLAVEWLVLYWMYKRKIFLTAGAMPPRSGWSLLILAFLCGAVSGAWTATGEIVGAET